MNPNATRRGRAPAVLSLLLVAALPALARADDVTLGGTVRGPEGRPLAGAMVAGKDTAFAVQAGAGGAWRLVVPSGAISLEARHPGYRAARLEVQADGDRGDLDFTL